MRPCVWNGRPLLLSPPIRSSRRLAVHPRRKKIRPPPRDTAYRYTVTYSTIWWSDSVPCRYFIEDASPGLYPFGRCACDAGSLDFACSRTTRRRENNEQERARGHEPPVCTPMILTAKLAGPCRPRRWSDRGGTVHATGVRSSGTRRHGQAAGRLHKARRHRHPAHVTSGHRTGPVLQPAGAPPGHPPRDADATCEMLSPLRLVGQPARARHCHRGSGPTPTASLPAWPTRG